MDKKIKLTNKHLLAFDCHGTQQPLSSTKAKIWLGSAHFESIDTTFTQAQAQKTLAQAQKLAVRKLTNQFISWLTDHPTFQTTNQKTDQTTTYQAIPAVNQTLHLDDTHFPYRLQPLGYPVSFSHSQQQVACAIGSTAIGIGIDLELNLISANVSQRYFHRNELDWLQQLQHTDTTTDYSLCQQARNLLWMLKEASIKAFNTGQLISGLKVDMSLPAQNLITQQQQYLQQYTLIADTAFSYTHHLSLTDTTTAADTSVVYIFLPYLQLVVVSVIK